MLSKLKDTARDAVNGKTTNNTAELKDILKQYFSPKKPYPIYCSELKHCKMREGEIVLEYFARMKKISDGASAGLTETFV